MYSGAGAGEVKVETGGGLERGGDFAALIGREVGVGVASHADFEASCDERVTQVQSEGECGGFFGRIGREGCAGVDSSVTGIEEDDEAGRWGGLCGFCGATRR